jgi:diguanylate cyclase (GGDEF)-like protein
MRLSIQSKFTLSLLITSLIAVLLVGLAARWLLLREFSQLVQEDAFGRFRISITKYVKAYGSLEQALERENFGAFQRRNEPALHRETSAPEQWSDFRRPDDPEGNFGPGGSPEGSFSEPPPGDGHGVPPQFGEGEPGGMGGPGGPLPGPQTSSQPTNPNDNRQPPYRFMLLDAEGRLRGGEAPFPDGSLAPQSVRKTAFPVVVGGKVVALAVPDAHPNLNQRDVAYLGAVNQALGYALAATFLIAIFLGAFVGRRLGGDLGILTRAVKAVGEGSLGQEVRIRSRDEVGVLAGAFNRMSTELARAREEVEQSAAQIREQAARLQELSIRDDLTGLYNRRYFDEQATSLYAQARRYQQPLTFVVGDIDYFKRINDRFSHAVGDEVLRRIAVVFRTHMRESDVVARYGGEEFVMALINTPAPQAAVACEKLRRALEGYPWHEIHPDLRVTMSLGLCDWLVLGGPEPMIGAADGQLYRAKEEGRNRVSWEKTLPPVLAAIETQLTLQRTNGRGGG